VDLVEDRKGVTSTWYDLHSTTVEETLEDLLEETLEDLLEETPEDLLVGY
jgi:hypothetical protein